MKKLVLSMALLAAIGTSAAEACVSPMMASTVSDMKVVIDKVLSTSVDGVPAIMVYDIQTLSKTADKQYVVTLRRLFKGQQGQPAGELRVVTVQLQEAPVIPGMPVPAGGCGSHSIVGEVTVN